MANKVPSYQAPRLFPFGFGALSIAIFLGVAALLLLPLTQYLAGSPKERINVRQMNMSLPPPPPPPPEPPPPEEEETEEPPPQMEPPAQLLSLNQLAMAINPGVGSALAGDFSLGGMTQMKSEDTVEEMQLFSIADLDQRPQPNRTPDFGRYYPRNLMASRTEGFARVAFLIREDGRLEFLETEEATHPAFAEAVLSAMRNISFSKPTVNGKPVRAKLILNIPFSLR